MFLMSNNRLFIQGEVFYLFGETYSNEFTKIGKKPFRFDFRRTVCFKRQRLTAVQRQATTRLE